MGIYHDVAFSCLPEDLGQHHHREAAGFNDILKDASRSHAGQLVLVSHQDQPGAGQHGFEKRVHQGQVHHGHLVNDENVCIQGIFFISLEPAFSFALRASAYFQKPVDGGRLISGGLCHPFGRSSGRRGQKDRHALAFKEPDHGIDGGGLSGSRSSGQHQDPPFYRFGHCLFLHLVQAQPGVIFDFFQTLQKQVFGNRLRHIQVMEHFCSLQLHVIKMGCIDPDAVFCLFYHDLSFHGQVHQVSFDMADLYFQKPAGPP